MIEFVVKCVQVLFANCEEALTGGIIVTSAVIVIMGVLKKFLFDKVQNKLVRKVLLAFTSVFLSFIGTLIYFLADGINFDYYGIGSALNAVLTIVMYWLYENTLLRNFVQYVGEKAISAALKFILTKNNKEEKLLKAEVKSEVKAKAEKYDYTDLTNL